LSACASLADFRGATNAFTLIEWPPSMPLMWHVCVRDNPQFVQNVPLDQMPNLKDCYIWNDSQTGVFAPPSIVLADVEIDYNRYTSIDLSRARYTTKYILTASNCENLTSVIVGASGAQSIKLPNCKLGDAAIAALLADLAPRDVTISSPTLDLVGNPGTLNTGSGDYLTLIGKGWIITPLGP
jgi:hypothetical protein